MNGNEKRKRLKIIEDAVNVIAAESRRVVRYTLPPAGIAVSVYRIIDILHDVVHGALKAEYEAIESTEADDSLLHEIHAADKARERAEAEAEMLKEASERAAGYYPPKDQFEESIPSARIPKVAYDYLIGIDKAVGPDKAVNAKAYAEGRTPPKGDRLW